MEASSLVRSAGPGRSPPPPPRRASPGSGWVTSGVARVTPGSVAPRDGRPDRRAGGGGNGRLRRASGGHRRPRATARRRVRRARGWWRSWRRTGARRGRARRLRGAGGGRGASAWIAPIPRPVAEASVSCPRPAFATAGTPRATGPAAGGAPAGTCRRTPSTWARTARPSGRGSPSRAGSTGSVRRWPWRLGWSGCPRARDRAARPASTIRSRAGFVKSFARTGNPDRQDGQAVFARGLINASGRGRFPR